MRITLVMVSSADGKTTHPAIHGWSSPEDQTHLKKLKAEYPVIIMGRKTYEAVRYDLVLDSQTRRIVMSKSPSDFAASDVPGHLEFTDESPRGLADRLSGEGYNSALLVGGSNLNEAFLKEKLLTDCYITIEPKFFGNGKSIFTSDAIDVALELTDVTRLNRQGTLVVHYIIHYEH